METDDELRPKQGTVSEALKQVINNKLQEEPVQETLEEFAKKAYLSRLEDCLNVDFDDGVKLGAKFSREQTIEDVFEWLTTNNYLTDLKETLIENFKNK